MLKNWVCFSSSSWVVTLGVASLSGLLSSRGAEGVPVRATTNSITMAALAAEVVKFNPEVNYYRDEIGVAKGERRLAGAPANPEVSTTLGQKSVSSGGLNAEGLAWSVSVQQPLEWPGRLSLRKAIANHQIQLAELGLARFQGLIGSRARLLAYQLFSAQEKATAAREVAERLQQLREVLVQRDPTGLTPMLETRIIEATELTLKRRSSEAELLEQSALLELNQLRGAPWTQSIHVEQPKFIFSAAPESGRLLAAAQTNNFELQMRRVELEQQGFRVSLAQNENHSGFTVGPYLSQASSGDREQQIGIAFSVPLPLWKGKKGSVETATARQRQAETLMAVAERNVTRQILEKAKVYQTKIAEMASWRPDSVEQFRAAATLADRHYRLGAVPIATYVELQKQYLEAIEALLDTKREALEAAQELQGLTGLDFNEVVLGAPEKPSNASTP